MNPRIVAVLNQKGGVGKTTTTVNLAHALAKNGKAVTVIDLDPQRHLSVALGETSSVCTGIDSVMLGDCGLRQQMVISRPNLNLVVAGPRLQVIEQLTEGGSHRGDMLKNALHACDLTDQDFVLIDCPPSSGILVANALLAVDELLIPMTSDYLALQGLSHLMGTLRKFEQVLSKNYRTMLVMSRFVSNRRLSDDVLATIKRYFPNQVLRTVIRETSLLAECPSFGKTIFEYRPGCRSAQDFTNLALDFIEGKVM